VGPAAIEPIGKENGWQVRQVASQVRNPDHAPPRPRERQGCSICSIETAGDQPDCGSPAGAVSRRAA